MGKRVGVLITLVGLIGAVALFVYSIVSKRLDTSAAFKFIVVFVSLIISLVKLVGGVSSAKSPAYYLKAYEVIIGGCFKNDPKALKVFSVGLKRYNEGKYEKAVKIFEGLECRCTNGAERRAVGLFIGLCYTDWGLPHKTAQKLSELVERGEVNFSVYNNLGFAYKNMHRYDEALDAFENALNFAEGDDLGVACLNMASVYFVEDELCAAEDYAQKALAHTPKLGQASAMLAIICAANEDKEGFDTHFKHAVACGQDPSELRGAINAYLAHISAKE